MTNWEATTTAADAGCVFCRKVLDGSAEHIGLGVYTFEPLNPVTEGHRLFIPNLHVERADTSPMATGATFEMASTWAAQRGGDFNLIVNAGTLASQTVPHLHVHYVPRRRGDGLKLPWTDQHAGSTGTGNQPNRTQEEA